MASLKNTIFAWCALCLLCGCSVAPSGFARLGEGARGKIENSTLYEKEAARLEAYFRERFGDGLPLTVTEGTEEAYSSSFLLARKIVVARGYEKGPAHRELSLEMMRYRWFVEKMAQKGMEAQDSSDAAKFVLLHELAHYDQALRDPFTSAFSGLDGVVLREPGEGSAAGLRKVLFVNLREAYADAFAMLLFAAMEADHARFERLKAALLVFREEGFSGFCGGKPCGDMGHWTVGALKRLRYEDAADRTYAELVALAARLAEDSVAEAARRSGAAPEDVEKLRAALPALRNNCSMRRGWFAKALNACSSGSVLASAGASAQ